MTMPFHPLALAHRNPGPAPGFRVSGFSIRAWMGLRRQVCPDFLTLRDNRASLVAGLDAGLRVATIRSAPLNGVSRVDSLRDPASSDSPSSNPPCNFRTRTGGQRLARASRSDSHGMDASVSPATTQQLNNSRGESIRLTVFGPLPSPLASGRVGPTHAQLCARLSPGFHLSQINSHATADYPSMLACVSRSDSRWARSLRLPRPRASLSESDRLTAPGSAFASFVPRLRAWLGWQASSSAPAPHPPLLVSRSDSRKAIGGGHRESTLIDLPLRVSRIDSPLPAPARPKEVLP